MRKEDKHAIPGGAEAQSRQNGEQEELHASLRIFPVIFLDPCLVPNKNSATGVQCQRAGENEVAGEDRERSIHDVSLA
jgi:hypothetical protein